MEVGGSRGDERVAKAVQRFIFGYVVFPAITFFVPSLFVQQDEVSACPAILKSDKLHCVTLLSFPSFRALFSSVAAISQLQKYYPRVIHVPDFDILILVGAIIRSNLFGAAN